LAFVDASGVFSWARRDAEPNSAGRVGKVGSARFRPGEPTGEDDDLLDYAAGQTILQGGRVEFIPREQVPRDGLMAAILRY
jgi:hypothetical protein